MKSSPAAPPRKDTERERAYQKQFASLQDKLLLSLRDGAWKKVVDVATWLAPRVEAEFSVYRFLAEGGTHDPKLSHKAGEGQKLILQDLLDILGKKKLLDVRTNDGQEEEVRATPLPDDRFTIDPEFERLLPRAPDEVKKLEERLLVEEPRTPLVVWKGQQLLVDGHTRFRFFSLLGRKYPVVEMEFADRDAIITWLYDTHYGRRSYSPEMKAYVRGKQYLARKGQHGGARTKTRGQAAPLKTAAIVAAEYGIDARTVKRDAVFAGALDKIAEMCGDEVRQQVLSRVAKWTKRDVARLVTLDPATVVKLVRVALTTGRRPKFPASATNAKSARKSVDLPIGKPVAQVQVLHQFLGKKALTKLHEALSRFLARPEQPRTR